MTRKLEFGDCERELHRSATPAFDQLSWLGQDPAWWRVPLVLEAWRKVAEDLAPFLAVKQRALKRRARGPAEPEGPPPPGPEAAAPTSHECTNMDDASGGAHDC